MLNDKDVTYKEIKSIKKQMGKLIKEKSCCNNF